jgi:RluA family pseudouridine synthase
MKDAPIQSLAPILFENDQLLIVNKPEGVLTIPGRQNSEKSLLEILKVQRQEKLFVVHRLDKDVSGVLVFTKTADAHKYLNQAFETRNVLKTYMALVHGVFKKTKGTIVKPIREFGSGRMGVDAVQGKDSSTGYEVVEQFPQHTLLKVSPLTGRRHQIRVHLYSEGHGIVGDVLYGDQKNKNESRLMLHSYQINFRMAEGQEISVQADLPISFRQIRDNVRGDV